MRVLVFLLIGLFTIPGMGLAQSDNEAEGDSQIVPIGRNIYIYKNRGGNIGLYFGNESTLIIDTQFAEVTEDLLKDISRFSNKPIRYVINTHHHGDHTGGNSNFRTIGATLYSHDNARINLDNSIREGAEKVDTSILPDITIGVDMTFYLDNEEIYLKHLEKAHTSGDIMVKFKESNVIHTGDAYVKGRYPYIDTANGGSYDGYVQGLNTILRLCDKNTKIIPGHGDVANLNDVRELMIMLGFVYKRVAFFHLQGKSEQEILAMTDLTQRYDDMGWGDYFITREKFMKTIYDDVAKTYSREDREARARQIEEIRRRQQQSSGEEDEDADPDPDDDGGGL